MKTIFTLLLIAGLPLLAQASEPQSGTVIMISSIGGWVVLTSALMAYKEVRRRRKK